MPNFRNFDPSVPVEVKDSNGAVLTDKVDVSRDTPNEFTVIREIADVECGRIHIFTENEHIAVAM